MRFARIGMTSGPASPSGIFDDFSSYANGAVLGDEANWDHVQGSFAVDTSRAKASGGAVSIARYVGTFTNDTVAEVTIFLGTGNPSGIAFRCQPGAASAYFAYTGGGGLFVGYLNAGVDGGYSSFTSLGDGAKLRGWATGVGAATRAHFQKDTGAGWVDVLRAHDFGVYHDDGNPGISGFAASDTHVDDFRAYADGALIP